MGPWPDGSRRFKRYIKKSAMYPDGWKYYAFHENGAKHITDSNGRVKWGSIIGMTTLLNAHPNAVELFPPELAVSEGL